MSNVESIENIGTPPTPGANGHWLWPNVIPRGSVTVLDGDPGSAKSLLTIDLAARLTRGGRWPDGTGGSGQGTALLFCAEDERERTVLPRLAAAGGDTSRVVVRGTPDDADGSPLLPDDIEVVEDLVRENRPGLLVFDPFGLFVSSMRVVRRTMQDLVRLAVTYGPAIVLVRHLIKLHSARIITRGLGSIGVIGAARAGFLTARDPADVSKFVLTPTKANLGPLPPALSYRVGVTNGQAVIEWLGPTSTTAEDAARGPRPATAAERPDVVMAADWLVRALDKGERPAVEVLEEAMAIGISERTLYRAKAAARVESRVSNRDGKRVWKWALPHGSNFEDLPELSELSRRW
ncbi:MAG TPA: AAA family ATPase [Gemmataceae bacterium]|nr:AAA family ATPase [Gemmataceae bacterium]